MARPQDIPGTKNSCRKPAVGDGLFTFGADCLVGMHHRRWLRHADVDEVLNADLACDPDCFQARIQIDSRNRAAFAGLGCETPASWRNVSAPSANRRYESPFKGSARVVYSLPVTCLATARGRVLSPDVRVPATRGRHAFRYIL